MSLQCDNLSGELQDQWSSSFLKGVDLLVLYFSSILASLKPLLDVNKWHYGKTNYYVPPPKGWGTYCFWCGSRRRRRRRRRSFLSARYLLNHWMDLDQTGTEASLGQPNGVIRFR